MELAPRRSWLLTQCDPRKNVVDFLSQDDGRVRPLADLELQKGRRRHARQALVEEAALLSEAWDGVGVTAIYNGQLLERMAELKRLVANRLGRLAAQQPLLDGLIMRRNASHVPTWEPGVHFDVAEVIRQALRKLGIQTLPSHLAGLLKLRRHLRRLGVRLFGFFGQAKVDGRNNP